MALTLPYPSMSFVPLDVLTAEEMNHIVSNYTYIANQFPISPNKASFTAYSTTETVVGTWINGKPLYRKVVPFGALPNNKTKQITLNGGTGAGTIRIVKIDAYMTSNTPMTTYARPIPCWSDTAQRITCFWSEYVYQIDCNYDASSFNANIVEYYWRTTD